MSTLAAVLLGIAQQGERGLVLCVEARLPPQPTPSFLSLLTLVAPSPTLNPPLEPHTNGQDSEHIDNSSLDVLDMLAKALAHEGAGAGAGAGRSKLFALLAVRTTEGVMDTPATMLRWVEEEAFATHLHVGQLSAEAARELASVTAQGGRLPHDVLDCAHPSHATRRAPPSPQPPASVATGWALAPDAAAPEDACAHAAPEGPRPGLTERGSRAAYLQISWSTVRALR